MSQIPYIDYIDKIILLENRSKRIKNYKLLNPINYKGDLDIIEIQKLAKLLSQHVGYEKLIFTVSFKDFKMKFGPQGSISNAAGNILLDDNEDVLIHLSRGLDGYPDAILATLSHEISHKYIHSNGLSFSNSYENEIFTDLTAVFLGFGKLMLNGVEIIEKETFGNTKKTYTRKFGYLNREQLAFIYLTVNYLYGIKRLMFYSQLNLAAIQEVKKIEKKYHVFFENIKIYRRENILIKKLRYKIAFLEKLARIISSANPSVSPINLYVVKEYTRLEFEQLNLVENKLRDQKNDFLQRTITNPKKSKDIRKDIPKIRFNSMEYKCYKRLLKINRKLSKKNLNSSLVGNKLNIIECPVCKKKLKVKNNNVGTITCPTCKFKFAADTSFNLRKVDYRLLKNNNRKIKEHVSIKDGKKIYLFNNLYQRFRLLLLINRYY